MLPIALAGSARAEDDDASPPLPAVPFGPGEVCTFDIAYGPVIAGSSSIEVVELMQYDGSRVYHLRTRARSARFFDHFFRVRDQADSYMDADSLYTRYWSKRLREGSYERDVEIHFDQKAHKAYFPDGKETETPPDVQDILTAFFRVRTLPLEPGMEISLPTHGDHELYALKVKVHERETLDSTALGKVSCIVVQPMLEDDGLFKHEGDLFVWLTDDARRIPVKLRARVPVGAIEARLTKYEPPKAARR